MPKRLRAPGLLLADPLLSQEATLQRAHRGWKLLPVLLLLISLSSVVQNPLLHRWSEQYTLAMEQLPRTEKAATDVVRESLARELAQLELEPVPAERCLAQVALSILQEACLDKKCEGVREMHKLWFDGRLAVPRTALQVPDYPARPEKLDATGAAPKTQRVSDRNPIAVMTHGICHAESYAIDLFVDLLARFPGQPKDFYDDFVEVCLQECKHFLAWRERLEEIGVQYGTLPSHDGLWRDAYKTRGDLLDRLAVINCVHEARGLDTYALSRTKLVKARDEASLAILDNNFDEEVDHVRKGVAWFKEVCALRGLDPKDAFTEIIHRQMTKPLKGPFNEEARARAGFDKSWYTES